MEIRNEVGSYVDVEATVLIKGWKKERRGGRKRRTREKKNVCQVSIQEKDFLFPAVSLVQWLLHPPLPFLSFTRDCISLSWSKCRESRDWCSQSSGDLTGLSRQTSCEERSHGEKTWKECRSISCLADSWKDMYTSLLCMCISWWEERKCVLGKEDRNDTLQCSAWKTASLFSLQNSLDFVNWLSVKGCMKRTICKERLSWIQI